MAIKNRCAYLETTALTVVALTLIVIAAFSLQLELLNAIYPSKLWGVRSEIIQQMMTIYGAGLILVAIASLIMIRYHRITLSEFSFSCIRSFSQEVGATFRWFLTTGQIRQEAVWVSLIIGFGAAVRFVFLIQPMRFDEAYTFLFFVNHDIVSLFRYQAPNNHVLHTLLVWISVELFGSHPVAIRLPAVLFGLLSIPLTFCLARTLGGNRRSGFFAATLIAVFPYLILYDTMARGYSLLIIFTLFFISIGVRISEHPSQRLCSLIALIIALGMLTMPSFLFPGAGALCWIAIILVQRGYKPAWVFLKILTPCTIMSLILTGILYTPVIIVSNGIESIIHNRYVVGLPLETFLTRFPSHITETINQFVRGIPAPVLLVFLTLLVAGFYTTARERNWTTFMLIPAVVIGSTVILFAKMAIPFDRTWIYFLPLIFLLIDAGLTNVVKCHEAYLKVIVLCFAGCAAVLIVNCDMISSFSDTGHFPEAPVLVDALSKEMTPSDKVVARCPADLPVRFYMLVKNVPDTGRPRQDLSSGREFFVIKPSKYSLEDMTKKNVRKLLKIGDAELYVEDTEKGTKSYQESAAPNGL